MTVIFCDSLRREVAEMLSVRRHGILKILLALHQSQRRYCSFCHKMAGLAAELSPGAELHANIGINRLQLR